MAASITECTFSGSVYSLSQLPRDKRPQIAFAGRSNVGKSSLLNRLVGRKKMAKVSSTPGKTRSLNFFLINRRFYFVDLPGYGYAKVARKVRESWGELVEKYLETSPDLIGLVLLLDCRRDPTPEDLQLLDWLADRQIPALVAITKVDKISRNHIAKKEQQVEQELGLAAIPFSALKGTGKNELLNTVFNLVADQSQRTEA
ncbi:YihA family ribosome biogenesis GTP-binding protein [candidate division GN15 bacterium]|nr:YihA family ribosome biogenesis GTP-binding protein [candidate division GN15 bacterium]